VAGRRAGTLNAGQDADTLERRRLGVEAPWQRCVVHWYRNIFSHVPSTRVREIAAMLKAIHASEDRAAAREKAIRVIEKLREFLFRATGAGDSFQIGLAAITIWRRRNAVPSENLKNYEATSPTRCYLTHPFAALQIRNYSTKP
jgi:Transposase, Mutator family